jgi:hypothetical protein
LFKYFFSFRLTSICFLGRQECPGTRAILGLPLFAVCGQNVRRQLKKNYGPHDLATRGTQTDDSDVTYYYYDDDDIVKRMRRVWATVDLKK